MDRIAKVLVVEDEPEVQAVVQQALEDAGFEALAVASGEEAIELLRRAIAGVCGLVTDIRLSGSMDGWEVAHFARRLAPAIPVIYVTGADAKVWPSEGVPDSVMFMKPFDPDRIASALHRLLEKSRGDTIS
ncbi:response regulator [Bradyrhizobium sp.]|uniref:response regulator n=1 Tax=Bradyrhizobium sp. TaxID=376 RepID=UPI0040376C85